MQQGGFSTQSQPFMGGAFAHYNDYAHQMQQWIEHTARQRGESAPYRKKATFFVFVDLKH